MARPNPNSGFAWNQRLAEAHGKAIRSVEEAGGSFEDWQKFLAGPNASMLGLLVMGKVKDFCGQLLKDALPTTMTVGDRTYDILGFLLGDETSVVGHTMVGRAKELSAHLGADDGQYLLDHQQDIPVVFRGKVVFVFTDWRHPDDSESVYYVYWYDGRWVRNWSWLNFDYWHGDGRVLRRKS